MARVAVAVGCNLAAGQQLIIAAPVGAEPLVDEITAIACADAKRIVTTAYDDPDRLRETLLHESAPFLPDPQSLPIAEAMAGGAARIRILGPRPDILKGVSPARLMMAHKASGVAAQRVAAILARALPADSAIPYPTAAWAKLAFPDLAPEIAMGRLWDAWARSLRLDAADPLQTWRSHLAVLSARAAYFDRIGLVALHIRGSGTDLRLALRSRANWTNGTVRSSRGRLFVPQLPAEGVSVAIIPEGTAGRIRFSHPIALAGHVVEGLEVEIREGAITEVRTIRGTASISSLLEMDPAARRIAAITMVDGTSPAASLGVRFCNPMLDGAGANSLTLGGARCAEGETEALRVNAFFSDAALTIDGLDRTGGTHRLIENGFIVDAA